MPETPRNIRRREVAAGIVFLFASFAFLASLLMDFNFVSPYSTMGEDLSYLAEHSQNQALSSLAWLSAGGFTLLSLPLYLWVFRRHQRFLPFINGLFLLGAAAGFLWMGKLGLDMHRGLLLWPEQGVEFLDETTRLHLFEQYHEFQWYRAVSGSGIGAFVFLLGWSRIRIKGFPAFSVPLMILAGPALIFFNWYDPDHLGKTVAMAGVLLAVVVLSVRMINKGLGG
ncbi:MAG: hypothetical protein R2751_04050 [Bacteroidales bacterium]